MSFVLSHMRRVLSLGWALTGLFWSAGVHATAVEDSPAPWTLKGDGYIILSSMSKEANLEGGFISDSLKERYQQSLSVVMLVNYKTSPVGPYQELLYIPGTFHFGDGKTHASISKIFVSSLASVTNGRKNWGIPKELAAFQRNVSAAGQETVHVVQGETPIAKFSLSSLGPKIPVSTALLPPFFKTLAQELNGLGYVFSLGAQGWVQLASLDTAESEAGFFPNLNRGKVLLAVKVSDFTLHFPVPETYPLQAP